MFYVSTNGTSFTATVSSGFPASATIVAVYNKANDVWLVSLDESAGALVTGATYPTIFLAGQIGGVRGYYDSTDGGNTWKRINDSNRVVLLRLCDYRRFQSRSRVYIATNGRGIIYGDGTP